VTLFKSWGIPQEAIDALGFEGVPFNPAPPGLVGFDWDEFEAAKKSGAAGNVPDFSDEDDPYGACIAAGNDVMTCYLLYGQDQATPGGGGGRRYEKPDRGLVEDSVRGALIALTGKSDPARVAQLTDLYLRDDKRRFSGADVDPSQSIREMIRSYPDYQRIHQLRPESIDETEWIPTQVAQLMSAGVRPSAIDERAIVQAQVGVSAARGQESAFISEFMQTNRPVPGFVTRFQQAATASLRRVA
jgi:hypothetical protein